jgi:ribosome-associated translation inhibitor RaiA
MMSVHPDNASVAGDLDRLYVEPTVVVNAASPEIARYARMKITKALRHSPRTVASARVRISKHRDCAVARPVLAQANVVLNGQRIRVQVAGTAALQAIDLMEARLRRRLEGVARRRILYSAHRPVVGDNERPDRYGRPSDECRVVRRKAVVLRRRSVDQAVQDMIALDYDFHVFIEAGSAQDTVVSRTPDGRIVLAQINPKPELIGTCVTQYEFDPNPARALTTFGARQYLERSGSHFVMFRPSTEGSSLRGHLLYRRYDGHYGLIGW